MWIIGCDYHPRFQQIAFVNTETGEYGERRLEHAGEAEQFYGSLVGQPVRVGMEASGQARWFERLLAELGYELWIGDPGKIRAAATRKQKTDRRDAAHILELLLSGQFEKLRIWVPTAEQRDVRRALIGKAQATPKPKPLGKRKNKTSPSRRGLLDRHDLVIHG